MSARIEVLFLSENDVISSVTPNEAIRIAEEVLRRQGSGEVEMPPKQLLNLRKYGIDSYCNAMPAYLHFLGVSGIKWGGGFGENHKDRRLPFMVQTLILANPRTGAPHAMMSATKLTSLKTGAESALAGKYLGNAKRPMILTVIGVGDQGRDNVRMWLALHDLGDFRLEELRLVDLRLEETETFARTLGERKGLKVTVTQDLEGAVRGADAVVTCTTSEVPIVKHAWLKPGVVLASIGSYPEFEPSAVLAADKIVVDNWEQNAHRGEFRELIEGGKLGRERLHGELPEIVAGRRPGREREDELICASLIGLGSIDIGIAQHVYQVAKARGIGQTVTFME
jgi:ornithine cyclodeaminase/alanine dehydrogenase-like protein (mu-crystallin family)